MKKLLLALSILASLGTQAAPQPVCTKEALDIDYFFSGILKEDGFFGKNINMLNSCNEFDTVWFMRHTLDYILNVAQGRQKCGHPVAEFMFSVRNKGVWGNPGTLAQMNKAKVKIGDLETGEHSHFFPRHIFWMREGWLRFSIPDVLNLSLHHPHTFTLGAFPFELGRGISLGSAYAVGQDFLGFYTDGLVDQYAMGFKASGEFMPNRFYYDIYGAILENMSAAISDISAEIHKKELGRREYPQRGFGKIHYAIATRFRWLPLDESSRKKVIIEPYLLYVSDPEQKVEFTADASSKLCTFGIAADYVSDRIECGFECAFNAGRQEVRGWDRNVAELQSRNGQILTVNSHVLLGANPDASNALSDLSLYKMPVAPQIVNNGVISPLGKVAQEAIDSFPGSRASNGQPIGNPINGLAAQLPYVPAAAPGVDPDQLYNAKHRFRDAYKNRYNGWMFVADFAWWNESKDIRLGFETGVASGDENPNFTTHDGDYAGFLSIQETYAGRKVRSQFVLGGAGKIKRPLSAPDEISLKNVPAEFAVSVNGFTNLVYTGGGVLWTPLATCKKFSFNPNLLFFWEEHATRGFDHKTMKPTNHKASPFLGIEANLFTHYMLLDNLRLFFIGSVFVPGSHYSDIKGIPFSKAQKKELEKAVKAGIKGPFDIPGQGDNTAYTLNLGLEYKF